jgi:hypothetical protein
VSKKIKLLGAGGLVIFVLSLIFLSVTHEAALNLIGAGALTIGIILIIIFLVAAMRNTRKQPPVKY